MLKRLAQIEFAIGVLIFGAIVVLVFSAAVMRYFGRPLIWSVDMAQLLFIWLCFLGATKAMREKGHLGVDLIVRLFGHRFRLLIETAVTALALLLLGVLAREGYALTMMNRERLFGDSGISYAFVTVAVPVGCVMIGIAILYNLIVAWRAQDGETLIYSRTDAEDLPLKPDQKA